VKHIHPFHVLGNALIDPRGELDRFRDRLRRQQALRRGGDTTNREGRKIFVLCTNDPRPVGGYKVLYRHVDVLNALSIPATILHTSPGFRCSWFANSTAVTDTFSLTPSSNDVVVVPEAPEGDGPGIAQLFPGVPKVVFNQNCYFTFTGYSWDTALPVSPYEHPDVLGAMTVSTDSREYLEIAFPGLQVERIHVSIDPTVFHPERRSNRESASCLASIPKMLPRCSRYSDRGVRSVESRSSPSMDCRRRKWRRPCAARFSS